MPRQPQPRIVPAIWKYNDVRPLVMRAGSLISAQEAVRRVLIPLPFECRCGTPTALPSAALTLIDSA